MLHQLTRSEPLVRCQFVAGGCEIFNHRLLFHAQISMTHFRSHFFRFDLIQTSVDRNARDPVLQRHIPRKLRQLLEYLNENHLAEVFLRSATRPMPTDDPGNQRIKPSHQRPSCVVVVLKRTVNHDRLGCALVTTSRVEVLVPSTCGLVSSRLEKFCNRSTARSVMSFKGAKGAL